MAISIAGLVLIVVGFAIYSKGKNRTPTEPRDGPKGTPRDTDDR